MYDKTRRSLWILMFALAGSVLSLSPAHAEFKLGPFGEGSIGWESGSYEFDNNLDEGDFDAVSFNARLGLGTGVFFVGGEYNLLWPISDSTAASSSRDDDTEPLLDGGSIESYGATLGLSLGDLRLFGTYFPYEKFEDTITNSSGEIYDFNYIGQGYKTGISINVVSGFVVSLEYRRRTFDQYKISDSTDESLEVNKTAFVNELNTEGYLLSIGWRFDIEGQFR